MNVFTKCLYNRANSFNFSQFGPLKAFIHKIFIYKYVALTVDFRSSGDSRGDDRENEGKP